MLLKDFKFLIRLDFCKMFFLFIIRKVDFGEVRIEVEKLIRSCNNVNFF